MKALELRGIDRLELVDIDIPRIKDDELLVRTGAATICTSDLHDIQADPFGVELPIIIGHEGAGKVVETGSAVTGFAPGDRVAAHPVHPCGTCTACREGMAHLCLNMDHFGLTMQGTFAEYFVVRADRARHAPDGVDLAVVALTEPICVCLEALHQARLQPGHRLLVIGDGPFGVLIARLASRLGLGRVVLAGHEDTRLAFGRGATPIDLFRVHLKELELVGSCNDDDRMDEAIALLMDDDLKLPELITHRFGIDDYRRAFDLAGRIPHQAMKVAIVF